MGCTLAITASKAHMERACYGFTGLYPFVQREKAEEVVQDRLKIRGKLSRNRQGIMAPRMSAGGWYNYRTICRRSYISLGDSMWWTNPNQ